MSSRITYQAHDGTTRIGIRESCTYGRSIELAEGVLASVDYHLSADPAELHRLTEAIWGEPGTWVPAAYDEVAEVADGAIEIGGGPERCVARLGDNPNWLRNHAANSIALAEYLEARDAANAEAELRVAQLADEWTEFFRERADPVVDAAYPRALANAGLEVPQPQWEGR